MAACPLLRLARCFPRLAARCPSLGSRCSSVGPPLSLAWPPLRFVWLRFPSFGCPRAALRLAGCFPRLAAPVFYRLAACCPSFGPRCVSFGCVSPLSGLCCRVRRVTTRRSPLSASRSLSRPPVPLLRPSCLEFFFTSLPSRPFYNAKRCFSSCEKHRFAF